MLIFSITFHISQQTLKKKWKKEKPMIFILNVISSAISSLESEVTKTHNSTYNLFDISTIENQIHQEHKKFACQKQII